ncbi:MAG: methyltransferase domain-containing protein [Candidatus Eisenbacteria bacterium]|nr:methyltransferase domain-containing protein [Candidatus Eisenbacteria bacterium]
MAERQLPREFTEMLDGLERSYLAETDPIRASGFGGGAERWRSEREPILDAVTTDGDILDVGCANGYLLECLVRWGRERGLRLVPHGVDRSAGLVERARVRLPRFAGNLHVGDAWSWAPPRTYEYVYALYDCVPLEYLAEYLRRLFGQAVADGGRLIVGAYGSRSRGLDPYDVASFLESNGWKVSGRSVGGSPPVSLFAWTDRGSGGEILSEES